MHIILFAPKRTQRWSTLTAKRRTETELNCVAPLNLPTDWRAFFEWNYTVCKLTGKLFSRFKYPSEHGMRMSVARNATLSVAHSKSCTRVRALALRRLSHYQFTEYDYAYGESVKCSISFDDLTCPRAFSQKFIERTLSTITEIPFEFISSGCRQLPHESRAQLSSRMMKCISNDRCDS